MRDSIQDIRIDDYLRIGRGRRGKPARHTTRPFFGPRILSASPEADENGVGWAHLAYGTKPRQPISAVTRRSGAWAR
ncbi:MAG TPA: hypothetical protein VF512_10380, partial [Actinomycetota bacterium]